MTRWRRTLLPFGLAAVVLALGLGAAALRWLKPPPIDEVDSVSRAALEESLQAEAAPMPLQAADTDVILVIACTLRRDRIGAYGGAGTTPFFDRLAAAGAIFERNFAQASWTRPSIGAILTGRWPRPLHLDNRGKRGSLTLALDEGALTFAEVMRAAGYRTVGAETGSASVMDCLNLQGRRWRLGSDGSAKSRLLWRGVWLGVEGASTGCDLSMSDTGMRRSYPTESERGGRSGLRDNRGLDGGFP